jgi:hypothetical protein
VKTHRYKYKMKTCEVCGREYEAKATYSKRANPIYRSQCPHCGATDYAVTRVGHIEIPEHDREPEKPSIHDQDEIGEHI